MVAEPARVVLDGARPVRVTARISDTRDLRVPARTKVGTALSVRSDIAARPVHARTRVRGARRRSRSAPLPGWRGESAVIRMALLLQAQGTGNAGAQR